MFKPTLGNLWDYIVDEGCLRTDCGTEEYLIKWNGQHRVPANLDEISSGTTKYGITIPEEWKDKEVTLIEDLPFDEKFLFMQDDYPEGPYIDQMTEINDAPVLVFSIRKKEGQESINYAFPILGHKTIAKTFYSSLSTPESAFITDPEYLDNKIIIDFFGKPVLLTYQKAYWDEERQEEIFGGPLDSKGNKLKPKFSNFSFYDTTEKGFESLHFEIDGIKFNMNPHHIELPDGFKFDDENMERKDGIDYDAVLKFAHGLVTDIFQDNENYYSVVRNGYKSGPKLDGFDRRLQGSDIYGGKTIDVYDKMLNEKVLAPEQGEDPTTFADNLFGLMYQDEEIIDDHQYYTAAFTVGDSHLPESQYMKALFVTINDESNYQSEQMIEGDAELTLIDNVLSSLTAEQKYSLFVVFEKISPRVNDKTLVFPREALESEETFRRFMLSLLSTEWTDIASR